MVRSETDEPLYVVAMVEDVTEKRRLEEQLQQLVRLESVGELAGGVAHNFNNALTAISGYSELLARRLDETDPARRDVEQIKRVTERSADLTRQLLTFSRREPGHASVFSINDAVESARDLLSPLLGERLRLRLRLDRSLPDISCDRSQAEQVVTNLVLNAKDAMRDGGCSPSRPTPSSWARTICAVTRRPAPAATSACGSVTPASASGRRCCRGSSSPSSRPRSRERASDSASPWSMARYASMVDSSPSRASRRGGRRSRSTSRRRPERPTRRSPPAAPPPTIH